MKHLLHPGYSDADQLYDLQADLGERLNLARDPKHANGGRIEKPPERGAGRDSSGRLGSLRRKVVPGTALA